MTGSQQEATYPRRVSGIRAPESQNTDREGPKIGDNPDPLSCPPTEEGKSIFWRNWPKRQQAQQRVGWGIELKTEGLEKDFILKDEILQSLSWLSSWNTNSLAYVPLHLPFSSPHQAEKLRIPLCREYSNKGEKMHRHLYLTSPNETVQSPRDYLRYSQQWNKPCLHTESFQQPRSGLQGSLIME